MGYHQMMKVLGVLGCAVALQACAVGPPREAIEKGDHPALAAFYKQQAEEFREKANRWDELAGSYERHGEPHGKLEPKQHAVHCRAVAQNFRKAAEEADALAMEHGMMPPRRKVQ